MIFLAALCRGVAVARPTVFILSSALSPKHPSISPVARALRYACLALGLMIGAHLVSAQGDGTSRWRSTTGGLVVATPAIAADGTIVVCAHINSSGGRVLGIQPSGSVKWEFKTPDLIDASPAIASDGTIYVGCWDGKLYALNANGTLKWTFDTKTFIYSSAAIGADGTIYFGSGANALHALNPNGTEKWKKTVDGWVDSSPAIGADGTVYFASWDHHLYALNPDGTEKWRFDTKAVVLGSPAIGSDGTVYIGSTNMKLFALSATGALRWEYQAGGAIQSSPVLGADGTVYFGASDWYFHAVNPDGTPKWKYFVGHEVLATAAVRADGIVIFGAYDNRVIALKPGGTQHWVYEAGDRIESSPVVADDGTIYVGSFDNRLHAINGNGAPLSYYSSWPMFRGSVRHAARAYSEANAGQLVNLSTRGIGGRQRNLIVGFVVKDTSSRRFLIRAAGPALAELGVADPLPDPNLNLHLMPSGFTLFGNENWEDDGEGPTIEAAAESVKAFPFRSGSTDAAFLSVLPTGSYGAVVGSRDPGEGVVLAEIYDTMSLSTANAFVEKSTAIAPVRGLVNLSTRGFVGTGSGILISGLVVGKGEARRLLVRAVGPGLAGFGVENALALPQLDIYSGTQLLKRNTGWTSGNNLADLEAVQRDVWAFPLAQGSNDCAMLVTLPSGNYTLQVSGRNGTTGEALIELYVTP